MPNFYPAASTPTDTADFRGGSQKTAVVPITVRANDFSTHNRKAPTRCTLTLTSRTQLTGTANLDPTPENNIVSVEINVIDTHVTASTTVHESLIKSIAPVSVTIPRSSLALSVVKTVRPVLVNADFVDTPAGHSIGLSVDSISCPWVSVVSGSLDIDGAQPGAQSTVTLSAGRMTTGLMQFAIDGAVSTPNVLSPARCRVRLTATTNVMGNVEPDPTNNTTTLIIDVIDRNDF